MAADGRLLLDFRDGLHQPLEPAQERKDTENTHEYVCSANSNRGICRLPLAELVGFVMLSSFGAKDRDSSKNHRHHSPNDRQHDPRQPGEDERCACQSGKGGPFIGVELWLLLFAPFRFPFPIVEVHRCSLINASTVSVQRYTEYLSASIDLRSPRAFCARRTTSESGRCRSADVGEQRHRGDQRAAADTRPLRRRLNYRSSAMRPGTRWTTLNLPGTNVLLTTPILPARAATLRINLPCRLPLAPFASLAV